MTRPSYLVAIVGTDTNVGKTWIAQALLREWRACGLRVAARKPVQSYETPVDTDADRLAEATGEHPNSICPQHRWYPLAMAPPIAATALGRPRVELEDLVREIVWPERVDIAVVETVGGVRSPLTHDGDSIDLLRRLQPDLVLLVADAGLGTLNAIRLTLACLSGLPVEVVLNRFRPDDPLHRSNLEWLAQHDSISARTSIDDLANSIQRARSESVTVAAVSS